MKKKLLVFYGSPRRDGNSTTLMKKFVNGVADTGSFEMTEITLRDMKISPCMEIYRCKSDGICAINDDFQDIARQIDEVDAIALASPVMFYTVSAHTKILMDRCQSFWARKYILKRPSAKKKTGIFFCVGATKGAKLFDGIMMTAKYFFDAIDCELKHTLLVRGVDEKGDILKHPELLDNAYAIGRSLS